MQHVPLATREGDDRGSCCTAWDLYVSAKQQFGLGSLTVMATTKKSLFATKAARMSDILAYVKNYNNTALALACANANISWSEVIQNFSQGLPSDPHIMVAKDKITQKLPKLKCTKKTWDAALNMVNDRYVSWSSSSMSTSMSFSARGGNSGSGGSGRKRGGGKRKQCEQCNYWGGFRGQICDLHKPDGQDQQNTTTNANTNTNTNTTSRFNTVPSKATIATVVGDNTISDFAYIACTLPEPISSPGDSPIERLRLENPKALHRLVQEYSIILDTAATRHVIKNKNHFVDFDPASEKRVTAGVAGDVIVKGSGTCLLCVPLSGSSVWLHLWLPNCLYSPEAPFNLVSGGALIE
ncbi:hypothetical protein V5O48_019103 [Marasmius crinis-equi]|uniref:Retrovirus-related Pol polyprotein from transposon TNT 1-94-like beta-barrel domain-containing protein n=1 Tax=Marasmius crinis-equi TaxID=585013 RepID=A0ABR3EJE4_9AGAR